MKTIRNISDFRATARAAVRSQLRKSGIDPKMVDANTALKLLDDLERINPELIASLWYSMASDNQIKLFRSEWNKWQKRQL